VVDDEKKINQEREYVLSGEMIEQLDKKLDRRTKEIVEEMVSEG
jgi:hypothetical protein